MTIFWILAAGLAVLALVFVLPPLLRRAEGAADLDHNALNLDVFRQQLAELDADLALGKLDQDQYEAARRDLERELVHDLAPIDAPKAQTPAQPNAVNQRWAVLILALAIPAAAVALYLNIGALGIIPKLEAAGTTQAQAKSASGHATLPDGSAMPPLKTLAEQLAKRLDQQPDNPTGWLMLARTWFTLGEQDKGMAALERAYRIAPRQSDVLLAYAEALAEANDSRLAGRPVELLDALLVVEPGNLNGLWLRGMAAFQEADFPGALSRWEPLMAALDPAGPDAQELTRLMETARSKATMAGGEGSATSQPEPATTTVASVPAPAPAPATAASVQAPARPAPQAAPQQPQTPADRPAGVTVSVALDPTLAAQTTPDTTVFIYAKAVSGPPMPLAAHRVRVADLPVTLTLDDSMAMMPQMRLSAFPQVTVGARISRSGQAMPQPGDLEGEVSPVASNQAGTVAVIIARVRP